METVNNAGPPASGPRWRNSADCNCGPDVQREKDAFLHEKKCLDRLAILQYHDGGNHLPETKTDRDRRAR